MHDAVHLRKQVLAEVHDDLPHPGFYVSVYSRDSGTIKQRNAAMRDTDSENNDAPVERPWIVLDTTYDVEAWIDQYNRDLQRVAERKTPPATASASVLPRAVRFTCTPRPKVRCCST